MRRLRLLFLLPMLGLGACASPADKFVSRFADGLGQIPDAQIAREGIPACILMVESFLSASPDDPDLLRTAAGLYGIYGTYLLEDEERVRRLTKHALDYALRAATVDIYGGEDPRRMRFDSFGSAVVETGRADIASLFSLGSVWMDWIRAHRDDIEAVADLPRVEAIMERVIQLDTTYRDGLPHLYLALLSASLPAEKNEVVQAHFRRAISAAEGKSLMPGVFQALWLRDTGNARRGKQLLDEIVAGGVPDAPAYTLINQIALEKAQQALADLDTRD